MLLYGYAVFIAALAAAEKIKLSESKYKIDKDEFNCHNCGAPLIGEQCQYCKSIFAKEKMIRSTFKRKPPKLKKCHVCRENTVARMGSKVCSPECAEQYAIQLKAKQERAQAKRERKEVAERKEKLKSRSDYIKEAQIVFNSYIRERDRNKTCICCGLPLEFDSIGGGYDAGHYRSIGSAPHLRFSEQNVHGQRKKCNRYGAGRAIDYRRGLIDRIGIDLLEKLEADQTPRKFSIDELKAIKAEYKEKLKALLKSRANTPPQ